MANDNVTRQLHFISGIYVTPRDVTSRDICHASQKILVLYFCWLFGSHKASHLGVSLYLPGAEAKHKRSEFVRFFINRLECCAIFA